MLNLKKRHPDAVKLWNGIPRHVSSLGPFQTGLKKALALVLQRIPASVGTELLAPAGVFLVSVKLNYKAQVHFWARYRKRTFWAQTHSFPASQSSHPFANNCEGGRIQGTDVACPPSPICSHQRTTTQSGREISLLKTNAGLGWEGRGKGGQGGAVVAGQTQEVLPALCGKLAQHLPVPYLAQVRAKSFSKVCQNTKSLPEAFCIPLSTHLPTNTTAARKCLSLPSQPEEACEFGDVGMRGCAKYIVLKGRQK